jgi:nitrogen fixation NifU-like protein
MTQSHLYQEVILDHSRKPRNFGVLVPNSFEGEGLNPVCGDQLKIYLKTEGDVVVDVKFSGKGCAISVASASIMTTLIKGKTLKEIQDFFNQFHKLVTGVSTDVSLSKLKVFEGVSKYPSRVKCASLCWHTLQDVLNSKSVTTTTE